MKELLPLFQNPSHYLGCELNSIHKSKDIPLKWCLAFPDMYPVGVSYFGHQILYSILNKRKDIWAQRVYAPSKQVAEVLKKHKVPLATLEGDDPLYDMDIIGFSICHELCYTTILYMLELSNIPFFSKDRDEKYPLIIAGGEGVFNPCPIEPFFDMFVIGDGEEVILEISDVVLDAKNKRLNKDETLKSLSKIEGCYVPLFGKNKIVRRVYNSFSEGDAPIKQIVPFGKPVHDRFVVEITKGCTRGCRFCFAGMVNRPVRERAIDSIKKAFTQGIKETGYEDIGFLSLSVGDFSLLNELISFSVRFSLENHLSLSFPSLRAGSFQEQMVNYLGMLKKTGLTLAPEAGTQRLRDVINKGITEKEILDHAKWAFDRGWEHIKLYFMIGLPTETEEDLKGIFGLCQKILDLAPKKKRVFVSASISPFVPKPHTPFQWERQNSLDEIKGKIRYLKRLFKRNKRLKLSWPILEMSVIEGVFSRGDTELSDAVFNAYLIGDVFTGWKEHFDYSRWTQVFKKLEIDIDNYLKERDIYIHLPWDFIDIGVKKEFLQKERERSRKAILTPDCRGGKCAGCGVCDFKEIKPILNSPKKRIELKEEKIEKPKEPIEKFGYILWFEKKDQARYLSQIELQKVLERIFRRVGLPLVFSQGYTPRPKISFARALPVSVESRCELVLIQVTKKLDPSVLKSLNSHSIPGINFFKLEFRDKDFSIPYSKQEKYRIEFFQSLDRIKLESIIRKINSGDIVISKKDKEIDLREIISNIEIKENCVEIFFNWEKKYLNPLIVVNKLFPQLTNRDYVVIKQGQFFKDEGTYEGTNRES